MTSIVLPWALGLATTITLGLLGLVWWDSGRRIKLLEDSSVKKEICATQHLSLMDDIREIKESQKESNKTLKDISLALSYKNGVEAGKREAETT